MEITRDFLELPLLFGIVFLVVGLVLYFFPPKKINVIYGYKTFNSMKTQERWDFSQKYSSTQIIMTAIKLVILSMILPWFNSNFKTNLFFQIVIIIVAVGFMFYKIEKAIKINFPNE